MLYVNSIKPVMSCMWHSKAMSHCRELQSSTSGVHASYHIRPALGAARIGACTSHTTSHSASHRNTRSV